MIYLNERIYAIVRDECRERLRFISENVKIDREPSIEELSQFYNFSISLADSYSSDLPKIGVDELKKSKQEQKERRRAFAFKSTLDYICKKYDVVAFSHRYGGWTEFSWQYGNDITFNIHTNFGYGSASYFNILYKYKGVLLCPYADYVKYKNSTVGDILQNTKSYYVTYDEWKYVLQESLNFYNSIVTHNVSFIKDWIRSNLNKMIRGLKNFIYLDNASFDSYHFDNGIRISTYAVITHDDFWVIKSAKIANSLDFIENLKVLPVEFDVLNFASSIIEICEKFKPVLIKKINSLKIKIDKYEKELAFLTSDNLFILYKKLKEKYYYPYRLSIKRNKGKILFFLRALRRLKINYDIKEIRLRLNELSVLLDRKKSIESELFRIRDVYSSLEGNLIKITNYKIVTSHNDK